MKIFTLVCCALVLPCIAQSQDADMEHRPFTIGAINYFGYGGLPLQKVRAAVPWHVSDSLTFATFSKKPVEEAVQSVLGESPTDVNITCCDLSGHLEVFIGLPGSTFHPVKIARNPSGDARLDPEGLRLYTQEGPLLAQAVARGNAGEDDSQGYMLSNDPQLKKVNLAMRSYAFGRGKELVQVLQTSGSPKDRRAAAALLGYARSSTAQAEALSQATIDPDSDVRNNAVRALFVLSAASAVDHPQINPKPLIDLLYSGSWTDRNKASLLLLRMTDTRNPLVLRALQNEALPSLVEGASWADVPSHSTPFLLLLGRIEGIPDQKLEDMLKGGDKATIIAAATSTGSSRH